MKNTVSAEKQALPIHTISNARELGGYQTIDGKKVSRGKLLRSAALSNASSEELALLRDRYHLFAIIDMRASYEAAKDPEPTIEGVRSYPCKIMDEQVMEKRTAAIADILLDPSADPIQKMTVIIKSGLVSDRMYVEFLQSQAGKAGYREFFKILLEKPNQGSVLWHCTHGKDRTGVAAMLLLGVLNVNEETIMEDFLLTNSFFEEKIGTMRKRLDGYIQDKTLIEELLVIDRGVYAPYMQNAIRFIKENYGDIVGYVKAELGLTEADIAKLRLLYTE